MIILKQREGKWRIIIGDEQWEFPDLKTMQTNLSTILNIKDVYGRIKFNENERRI